MSQRAAAEKRSPPPELGAAGRGGTETSRQRCQRGSPAAPPLPRRPARPRVPHRSVPSPPERGAHPAAQPTRAAQVSRPALSAHTHLSGQRPAPSPAPRPSQRGGAVASGARSLTPPPVAAAAAASSSAGTGGAPGLPWQSLRPRAGPRHAPWARAANPGAAFGIKLHAAANGAARPRPFWALPGPFSRGDRR